jgi:BirA family transcriptional regulator, biotin operon repressor / biotin---[acetyl-CoA-carboxylase] ligase
MAFDVEQARSRMPGRRIEWHSQIDTTMHEAARLASEGAPSGTIVGAEMQWTGQGRLGRNWHSALGEGLYFTQILRIDLPPQRLPVVTLALGVAIADVLKLLTGLTPDLRWPNDVMLNERKVCGILTQLHNGAILAGVGLNVNQPEFPAPLSGIATSLRIETGGTFRREALLAAMATSIDSNAKILATGGAVPVLTLFSAASTYAEGKRVEVDMPSGLVRGITSGLTADGFLRVRTDDGRETVVTAGGVRPLHE